MQRGASRRCAANELTRSSRRVRPDIFRFLFRICADIFLSFSPRRYNWRQVLWCDRERVFYGVHGNSGYLFRFDPCGGANGGGDAGSATLDLVARLTSAPSRRRGDDDMFSYGYLGLAFFPDGRTLGYLTGGATGGVGTFSFMYRYILRESCSQFDLLPLTSLTISLLHFLPSVNPATGVVQRPR